MEYKEILYTRWREFGKKIIDFVHKDLDSSHQEIKSTDYSVSVIAHGKRIGSLNSVNCLYNINTTNPVRIKIFKNLGWV